MTNFISQSILVTFLVGVGSLCEGNPARHFSGSWTSDSKLISKIDIKLTANQNPASGNVSFTGSCWQCDAPRKLFALPVDSFAALPVASRAKQAEAIELSLIDKDRLKVRLIYRQMPSKCRPPFHCQWKVVDTKQVLLTRQPPSAE